MSLSAQVKRFRSRCSTMKSSDRQVVAEEAIADTHIEGTAPIKKAESEAKIAYANYQHAVCKYREALSRLQGAGTNQGETIHSSPNGEPTKRELQVLQLHCKGYGSNRIAALLKLNVKTIRYHCQLLAKRARCGNSEDLVQWALQNEHVSVTEIMADYDSY